VRTMVRAIRLRASCISDRQIGRTGSSVADMHL
jgi:hypothetical protein